MPRSRKLSKFPKSISLKEIGHLQQKRAPRRTPFSKSSVIAYWIIVNNVSKDAFASP